MSSESEDEDRLANFRKIMGKKRKSAKNAKSKPGRKAQWSDTLVNDMVDIIASDEYLQKRLIFTNSKNQKNTAMYEKVLMSLKSRSAARNDDCPFTAVQMRTKFKKLVAECKKTAMLMKTPSGIKCFQEERGYSAWFNQLFLLVKTRDSCQPDQAIEPSAIATSEQTGEITETSISSKDMDVLSPPQEKAGKKRTANE
eukprot:gene12532-13818_t